MHLSRREHSDEVDPYAKPRELLDVSPKGLVPALKLQLDKHSPPRGLNESTVIVEYLEEYVRSGLRLREGGG